MTTPTMETLQTQLVSARKSILFMETQHANTLKGLHAEIQQLQKKCSELTFNAAMNTDSFESDERNSRIVEQLEADIDELTREKITMVQQLEEKDRQYVALEVHAISQEKKYLNELKIKSHKISALSNEMDSRSNTIGYLTAQLHQARSKLHSIQQQQPSLSPAPPAIPRSRGPHRSSKSMESVSRPSSSSSYRTASVKRSVGSRPSSAASASGGLSDTPPKPPSKINPRFNPSPMPDPTPFLNAGEDISTAHVPKPPSVLPPIHRRSVVSPLEDSNGNQLYGTTNYSSRDKSTKHDRYQEAEKMAVRRVNTSISPERQVHEGGVRPL